jgi:LPS-assembly lipoprotein
LLFFLQACGFRPLYAPEEGTVMEDLSRIKISTISDRIGQILRNRLLVLLTPKGVPAQPLYKLDVTLNETKSEISLRKDATSRRTQITIIALYTLKDLSSQKVLLSGNVEETSGYSIGSQSDFASLPSIVSEKDTRERLIEEIAQELKIKLAAHFISKETISSAPQK